MVFIEFNVLFVKEIIIIYIKNLTYQHIIYIYIYIYIYIWIYREVNYFYIDVNLTILI